MKADFYLNYSLHVRISVLTRSAGASGALRVCLHQSLSLHSCGREGSDPSTSAMKVLTGQTSIVAWGSLDVGCLSARLSSSVCLVLFCPAPRWLNKRYPVHFYVVLSYNATSACLQCLRCIFVRQRLIVPGIGFRGVPAAETDRTGLATPSLRPNSSAHGVGEFFPSGS